MLKIGLVSFWDAENNGDCFSNDNAVFSTESSWDLLKNLKKYFLANNVLFDSYKKFDFNDIDIFLYRDLPVNAILHRKIKRTRKPIFFWQNEIWHLRKPNWINISDYGFVGVISWSDFNHNNLLKIPSNPFLTPSSMSEVEFGLANKIAMVNSNRTSRIYSGYQLRKEWLSKLGSHIDLYGRGWNRRRFAEDSQVHLLNSRYFDFIFKLPSPEYYKGPLSSKSLIKNKYVTSIVIENFFEKDYVTEKIWDSFAIGSIPIYAGPPNADELFDKFYIDLSVYTNSSELLNKVNSITYFEYLNYFDIYKNFIKSNTFFNSNDSAKKICDFILRGICP